MDDVIRLLDLCKQFSYIDQDAINMMGISRGGMMTYEVLRRDERVHKAVVISGLSDCFMSYADHIRFFGRRFPGRDAGGI